MSSNFFDIDNKALSDVDGNTVFAKGTTVPTDAVAGYVTGCYFLKTDGAGGTAVYVNEGSATSCNFNAVQTAGAQQIVSYSGQTGTSYTLLATDNVIEATGSANTLTIEAPTATAGLIYRFINSRSTVSIDVYGDAGQTVGGATTLSIGAGTSVTVVGNGTNFVTIT